MKLGPTMYFRSVYDIELYHLKGKKLICFDLDNTLDSVDNLLPSVDLKLVEYFEKLVNEDIELLIFSNNKIDYRVEYFAKIYGLQFQDSANKPFQKKYKKNSVINNYKKEEVVFVGDKLITDVLGANIYGSTSILVDPIDEKSTKWYGKVMLTIDLVYEKVINFKRKEYYES